jgi:hypothetical protein
MTCSYCSKTFNDPIVLPCVDTGAFKGEVFSQTEQNQMQKMQR